MCKLHDVPLNGHPHWFCKVNEYEAADGIPLWAPSFQDMWCPGDMINNQGMIKGECYEENWEVEIL